jgi:hypothetical protein
MPPGIHNAYYFQLLNTISFNMVAGVPMMLYVQSLGASAAIVAIIGALPNLLNILQIPSCLFFGARRLSALSCSADGRSEVFSSLASPSSPFGLNSKHSHDYHSHYSFYVAITSLEGFL